MLYFIKRKKIQKLKMPRLKASRHTVISKSKVADFEFDVVQKRFVSNKDVSWFVFAFGVPCLLLVWGFQSVLKVKIWTRTDGYSIGAVTGRYLSFLKATLDEMDKYPEMKGHYLVMDNAPIHCSTDIEKYIYSRGYRCLPSSIFSWTESNWTVLVRCEEQS